ncbi:MAG: leucine-rich repeat domain-containing protein [Ruminococcus sp.]|uniref:leucine-rich repeat domain-containing protein n=1 Tax=Ruminococcus sp. TaxID=41978 RepID=UPI0025CE0C18|nr:leucine-rich repeat domain-containing protein [Ruminococcus sp.]MBR0529466.1 leucine-rich repeat domain-containing protein [Ruminococcus sp.]
MKSKNIAAGLLALTFVFGGAVLPSGVVSNSVVASASSFRIGDSFYIDDIQYTIIGDGIVELRAYNPFEKTVDSLSVNSLVAYKNSDGDFEEFTVTRIGEGAFNSCFLESISLPDTVAEIGNGAFRNSYNLKTVLLPSGLNSIGYQTFLNCRGLESITLPDSVLNIGENAFAQCRSLSNIKLSDSLKNISQSAFADCESLKSITIPNGVQNIDFSAFYNCNKLEEIVIPESVIHIGNSAFTNCSSLETVVLPDNISIGDNVFASCTSLKNINIPTGISYLPSSTFNGCSSLTDITIPDNIKSIGNCAFSGCNSLTNVKISDSVESIGDSAFVNCVNLKDIIIPESVSSIGKQAFSFFDDKTYKYIINSNITIYGVSGSYAEEYANINSIPFSAITIEKPNTVSYPEVTEIVYSEPYHQFRLTWTPVDGADKYGIAAFIAGKWRVQAYTDKTTFTSPKLKAGDTYKLLIAARVNGEWDLSNINSRAFTVTVK